MLRRMICAFTVLGLLSLAALHRPTATEFAGNIKILDGDSLSVAGRKIKLLGIDAPELNQQCLNGKRLWRCGFEAALALEKLVEIRDATCEREASESVDSAGQTGRCFAGKDDVAEILLRRGYAIALADAPVTYKAAESEAQLGGLGLWRGTFVPPAAWRRGARLSAEARNPITCGSPDFAQHKGMPAEDQSKAQHPAHGRDETGGLVCAAVAVPEN